MAGGGGGGLIIFKKKRGFGPLWGQLKVNNF